MKANWTNRTFYSRQPVFFIFVVLCVSVLGMIGVVVQELWYRKSLQKEFTMLLYSPKSCNEIPVSEMIVIEGDELYRKRDLCNELRARQFGEHSAYR